MQFPSRCDRKVIIDTNVILFDALAIKKFKQADIYIPFSVIEEIDRFKRDLGENGRNARQFSRFIDVLRSKGSLAQGVGLENSGSFVYVNADTKFTNLPPEMAVDLMKADSRILATALALQISFPQNTVELISKDINLRIKADVFGIGARDYDPENTQFEDMYTGVKEIELGPDQIDQFYKETVAVSEEFRLLANQYVVMKDSGNPNHSAIGRFSAREGKIVPLIQPNDSIWGIDPRTV